MIEMLKYLKARYMSEEAQGIVEYALILAFVVVIAAALFTSSGISTSISTIFSKVNTLLQNGVGAKVN